MTAFPKTLFMPEDGEAQAEGMDAVLFPATRTDASGAARFVLVATGDGEDAIRRAVAIRPDGIALAGCLRGADVQRLDVLLSVAEAEADMAPGILPVLALTDGLLPSPRSEHGFTGKSPRLGGLVWDWQALQRLTGAARVRDEAGRWTDAFAAARGAVLLSAKAAGLRAYDAFDPLSPTGLEHACRASRLDGFDGVLVRRAADVAIVKNVFNGA